MLFAWALAGAVLVSGLFDYGTDFSSALAGGCLAVFSVLLLAWPRMNLFWHRGIAVVILLLIVTRWSMSWLSAEPADAITGLLYTPVMITITTLLWGATQFVHRCEHRFGHGATRLRWQLPGGAGWRLSQ